ncbi:Fe(3+) ABC transporter substrate-binding protein [Caldovatus aquaticus]|uniref:Fe(3+) ABC transporter substrate-binding protein n=1 Tax=Caldovatus aquaticus TaxID=2865671 RepID=A0ABS7F2E1_9PROT|nr:Fe(3+) ABC transporter substrate-binding protein [Caldovatus aquaticus]MBW8269771.1 Fe(3+) ABC transporter substrate-binding protein [Caldovatus aquaticus]
MRLDRRRLVLLAAIGATAALVPAAAGRAQQGGGGEVAVYSARHYDTDRQLYEAFTRETGIRVRLIEGDADQLIARIRSEGRNSPADVLITVDAARLARAKEAGLTAPHGSALIAERVPAALRDPDGHWFAVSQRARAIMYDRERGAPEGLARYEDLADPRFRGQICVRSGSHPYNVGLVASILAANGPERTEEWARGLVANMARPPQGGDRDQFRAIPAGQCRIAIANTYYLGQYGRSEKPEDQALFRRIGVIFPNQAPGDRGTHVNISGAALVRTAPHRAEAVRFLEYLTGPRAQELFALGNMEYPAVADAPLHPALAAMGRFRAEPLDAAGGAARAAEALQIIQRAGWR